MSDVTGAVLTASRLGLQRVATHIMARRRFDVSGRFGLRAGPGGLATPAFGDGPEAIRLCGTHLVREVGGAASYTPVIGSTLRQLAAFAGVDLDAAFSCGSDTPPLGDVDAPLDLDAGALAVIAQWYHLGWKVLDATLAGLPAAAGPSTIQLWPEHFDAGTNVGLPSGEADDRVNLGFSPGDSFEEEPYLYLGPWTAARPGDPAYWNAGFGAVLRRTQVLGASDPLAVCQTFLQTGLDLLSGS